jgi:hypothetical protein
LTAKLFVESESHNEYLDILKKLCLPKDNTVNINISDDVDKINNSRKADHPTSDTSLERDVTEFGLDILTSLDARFGKHGFQIEDICTRLCNVCEKTSVKKEKRFILRLYLQKDSERNSAEVVEASKGNKKNKKNNLDSNLLIKSVNECFQYYSRPNQVLEFACTACAKLDNELIKHNCVVVPKFAGRFVFIQVNFVVLFITMRTCLLVPMCEVFRYIFIVESNSWIRLP